MKKLYITLKKFTKEEIKEFKKRRAADWDCSILVDEECEIYNQETWEKIIVMKKIPNLNTRKLMGYLEKTRFYQQDRTNGMLSTSRIFGYAPRNKMRQDFCTATALAREYPECHNYIVHLAKDIEEIYKETLTEKRGEHNQMVTKVLPDYKLNGSVFTSGIINKNNPLPYHHDAGNFENVFSNMITVKDGIEWGMLYMPELDIKINLLNGSVIMFDGQKILHGVSPIKKIHTKSYRYTIVFYSLKQMRNCLDYKEELRLARKTKTEIYAKRRKILVDKKTNEDSNTQLQQE